MRFSEFLIEFDDVFKKHHKICFKNRSTCCSNIDDFYFALFHFDLNRFEFCCINEWVITTFMIVFKKTIVDACYVCVKLLIFDNDQLWTFNFIVFWILLWLLDVYVKNILNFTSMIWFKNFQHDSIDLSVISSFFIIWHSLLIFKSITDAQINLNTNANWSFFLRTKFLFTNQSQARFETFCVLIFLNKRDKFNDDFHFFDWLSKWANYRNDDFFS